MTYALAMLKSGTTPIPAIEVDGRYYALEDVLPGAVPDSRHGLLDLVQEWGRQKEALDGAVANGRHQTLAALPDPGPHDFASPLSYPGKVVCTGTNYRDHLRDDLGVNDFDKSASDILYFQKHQKAVVGSGDVRYPSQSRKFDWEVELVAVVGREGRRVSVDKALDLVAFYAVGIDLSARDWQLNPRHPKSFDLLAGKSFDDSAPLGPKLVPAGFVTPTDLELKLSVNGVQKQKSHTREMIWSIAEQIAELSQHMTLEPGDVLYTGSPGGVGFASNTFLQVGDTVEAEITGLGRLAIQIVADPAQARARTL